MITVYLLSIAALALFALLAVTPLLAALPDAPTQAEHDDPTPPAGEPDPWDRAVSPVTVETFGRGTLPARVVTTHDARVYDLYGRTEQH